MEYYSVLALIGVAAAGAFLFLALFVRRNVPSTGWPTEAQAVRGEGGALEERESEENRSTRVLLSAPEVVGSLGFGSRIDSDRVTRLMLLFLTIAISVPLIFIRQATWSWSAETQFWVSAAAAGIGTWWLVRNPWIARAVIPRDQTARTLAWIRVVVCAALLLLATRVRLSDVALLPEELVRFQTLVSPLVDAMWSPAEIRDPGTLLCIQVVTIVTLIGAFLGLGGKPMMFAAASAYTIFYHIQITYTHFFHSGLIPLQILYALCFMPTHRALSLDKVLAQRLFHREYPADRPASALTYGWCVYLCWVIYGVSYCATGLSKFWVTPFWPSQGNVLAMSLSDSLHIIEYDFNLSAKLVNWGVADIVFPVVGLSAMVIEWSGILLLFSAWARKVVPWLIGGLHLGIWFCHDFLFYELAVMPLLFLPLYGGIFKAPSSPLLVSAERPWFIRVGATAIICMTCTMILSGWLYSRDKFPLLSYWGMYAVHAKKPLEWVHYSTVYKVRESGSRERTELIEYFSVLNHARWLDHVGYSSDPAQMRRTKALFTKVFELEQGAADPVVRFEIESNSWNVKASPSDSHFGGPTRRMRFNRDGTVVEEIISGAL